MSLFTKFIRTLFNDCCHGNIDDILIKATANNVNIKSEKSFSSLVPNVLAQWRKPPWGGFHSLTHNI